ncbi:hypothetical protein GF382_02425 [Candidatus Falkowbacteria bacterium]|nr:hypothetical protein [Candidatus Falkowbacteria bacterium]
MFSPTHFSPGACIVVCSNDKNHTPTADKDILRKEVDAASPPFEITQENQEGKPVKYRIIEAFKDKNIIHVLKIT